MEDKNLVETKKVEEKTKKQERINECTKKMNEILDQYACTLQSYFIVTSKGNFPKIEVISK